MKKSLQKSYYHELLGAIKLNPEYLEPAFQERDPKSGKVKKYSRVRVSPEYHAVWDKALDTEFGSIWPIHERYKVHQPKDSRRLAGLVPDGPIVRWYAPTAEPSLPGEIARIYYGYLKPEEFASRYGLLGFSELVPPERRGTGDPLDWVKAHAHTVAKILELLELLQETQRARHRDEGSDDRMRQFLESLPQGPFGRCEYIARGGPFPKSIWLATQRDPLHAAHSFLLSRVNPNIEGICRKVTYHKGRCRSLFHFRAMIEAVYWQLADRLDHGGIRRCKACRHCFLAADKRQKFCPPPLGVRRSRCASRFFVTKFRRKSRPHKKRKEAR